MPGPALVEELDHRVVGADGHDELGAALVGEEHGGVLARALDHELHVGLAEGLELLVARGCARRGGRGGRARRRPPCPAADTESKSPRMMSGLSPTSSSASAPPSTPISTGRNSRMYGAQDTEVLLVVEAAHDDEGVASGERGAQLRQRRSARTRGRPRAARTRGCSRRTAGARGRCRLARFVHPTLDLVLAEDVAARPAPRRRPAPPRRRAGSAGRRRRRP